MGGSSKELLEMAFPFPGCPMNLECHVKENLDRKKECKVVLYTCVDNKGFNVPAWKCC